MHPALVKTLHTFGFALGFWLLMGGGMRVALILVSFAHADLPTARDVGLTALYLGGPLLAFRAYDRSKQEPAG